MAAKQSCKTHACSVQNMKTYGSKLHAWSKSITPKCCSPKVKHVPSSESIWLKAHELEDTTEQKKIVLRKGLENVPKSEKLWKALVALEENQRDCKIILASAVECAASSGLVVEIIHYQISSALEKFSIKQDRKCQTKSESTLVPRTWKRNTVTPSVWKKLYARPTRQL